jgi:hypothetical protein
VQKEDLMGNAWAARSYVRAFVGIKAKHFALHFVHASCTAGRIQMISSSPRAALPACRLLTFNRRLKAIIGQTAVAHGSLVSSRQFHEYIAHSLRRGAATRLACRSVDKWRPVAAQVPGICVAFGRRRHGPQALLYQT